MFFLLICFSLATNFHSSLIKLLELFSFIVFLLTMSKSTSQTDINNNRCNISTIAGDYTRQSLLKHQNSANHQHLYLELMKCTFKNLVINFYWNTNLKYLTSGTLDHQAKPTKQINEIAKSNERRPKVIRQ